MTVFITTEPSKYQFRSGMGNPEAVHERVAVVPFLITGERCPTGTTEREDGWVGVVNCRGGQLQGRSTAGADLGFQQGGCSGV